MCSFEKTASYLRDPQSVRTTVKRFFMFCLVETD